MDETPPITKQDSPYFLFLLTTFEIHLVYWRKKERERRLQRRKKVKKKEKIRKKEKKEIHVGKSNLSPKQDSHYFLFL